MGNIWQLVEKFDIEKQNLLDEMDMLRRARETFETEKRSRDEELRQIRDRSRLSSDELKNAQAKIRLLEQQVRLFLLVFFNHFILLLSSLTNNQIRIEMHRKNSDN